MPADVPTTGPNLRKAGEKPPVMPITATKHTPAGAKAFAKFFIQTIDWGYATVSGSYTRHYSTATCASCASVANGLDADRKAGHRYIGGRLTIIEVRQHDGGATNTQIVTTNGTSFEEVDRNGKYVTADEAHKNLRYNVTLRWQRPMWAVTKLTVTL